MAMAINVESGILNWMFNYGDVFSSSYLLDALYLGLTSGVINNSGTNLVDVELSGGAYSRQKIVNATGWYDANISQDTVQKGNASVLQFNTATAPWSGIVNWFLVDSGNNFITYGSLANLLTLPVGTQMVIASSGIHMSLR